MAINNKQSLIDLICRPIITDKTTKLIEENQYSFAVNRKANKREIKQAIEYIFNVNVKNISTCKLPIKKKRVGRFIGKKTQYKKAILTLQEGNTINIFSNN